MLTTPANGDYELHARIMLIKQLIQKYNEYTAKA